LQWDTRRCYCYLLFLFRYVKPTFIFIKSKKELSRIRGADPAQLENKLKEYAIVSVPFTGAGQRLGGNPGEESEGAASGGWLSSLLGGAVGLSGSDASQTESLAENEALAFAKLDVDETAPCTKINLRLVDGSKYVHIEILPLLLIRQI